jgi:uroporphyrinogen decarboxylase
MKQSHPISEVANTGFQPDYQMLVAAAWNRKPARLPLYEHIIAAEVMERLMGVSFATLHNGTGTDLDTYFHHHCRFFREMTYDTVSYEVCVTDLLPGGGALLGEREGVIQTRADFEAYPWDEFPAIYWEYAAPRFDALAAAMPAGMKAVGGIGNGVFEISQDLVGFSQLCYMQADDPELFGDLYLQIGRMLAGLWHTFLQRYRDCYCVARIGDDLGFKTSTLIQPQHLLDHVIPQYRPIIEQVHGAGMPYLQHSCGKIFPVMDAWIAAGINAKHSNEDAIAPYDEWISRYGARIGMFGGFDTDRVCRMKPAALYDYVLECGSRFRATARGYALGSGNSIADYVPVDGYLAMVRAAQQIRNLETR